MFYVRILFVVYLKFILKANPNELDSKAVLHFDLFLVLRNIENITLKCF